MKKTKLLLLSIVCSMAASAQTVSDGYYRIQNVETERYISASDNYGYYPGSGTTVDVSSLKTKVAEGIESDVASVIYIKNEGNGLNLTAQGYDTYPVFNKYLSIWDNGNSTYKAYIRQGNTSVYLFDMNGVCTTNTKAGVGSDWKIIPISDDNYFGVAPSIQVGEDYYQSFYADFPFTVNSNALKAYTVSEVDNTKGVVIIEEAEGQVEGATPVIFKSSSNEATYNRLNVEGTPVLTTASGYTGNDAMKTTDDSSLGIKGVFFCNPDQISLNHFNAVAYDPATMRVLGTSNNKLAFVKANLEYVPANTCYIRVTEDAPEVFYVNVSTGGQTPGVFGDVTGDGVVDTRDLVTLNNMVMGKITPNLLTSDLDGDGEVTVLDAQILANILKKS